MDSQSKNSSRSKLTAIYNEGDWQYPFRPDGRLEQVGLKDYTPKEPQMIKLAAGERVTVRCLVVNNGATAEGLDFRISGEAMSNGHLQVAGGQVCAEGGNPISLTFEQDKSGVWLCRVPHFEASARTYTQLVFEGEKEGAANAIVEIAASETSEDDSAIWKIEAAVIPSKPLAPTVSGTGTAILQCGQTLDEKVPEPVSPSPQSESVVAEIYDRYVANNEFAQLLQAVEFPFAVYDEAELVPARSVRRKLLIEKNFMPYGFDRADTTDVNVIRLSKKIATGVTVSLEFDFGTWSRQLKTILYVRGLGWKRRFPIQLPCGPSRYAQLTSEQEFNKAITNLGAAYHCLESTFLQEVEQALNASTG